MFGTMASKRSIRSGFLTVSKNLFYNFLSESSIVDPDEVALGVEVEFQEVGELYLVSVLIARDGVDLEILGIIRGHIFTYGHGDEFLVGQRCGECAFNFLPVAGGVKLDLYTAGEGDFIFAVGLVLGDCCGSIIGEVGLEKYVGCVGQGVGVDHDFVVVIIRTAPAYGCQQSYKE